MQPDRIRSILRDEILPTVSKPARYLGNELNSVHKEWSAEMVKVALAFPDVYEVGMSHLGLKILYHLLNQEDDVLAERVYAPWPDMEEALQRRGVPLFSLESSRPLKDFDLIGFTLQYELSFTTILNMLDLAGLAVFAADRQEDDPLVISGGPCAFNPEPLAPFIDLFVIGEAEEILPRLAAEYRRLRASAELSKAELLRALAELPGVYVPALYEPVYDADGKLSRWEVRDQAPFPIKKQVIKDLDQAFFPTRFIVPYLETVHDRAMVEVFRGCARGCRFCQAGMIYRPVRERSVENLVELAQAIVLATGYDELSLVSLSTGDYTGLTRLVEELLPKLKERGIALSLPSLRIDTFAVELAEQIQSIRKTGLTFAPEAGTARLRDVINKNVTEEDLLRTTEAAFRAGWHTVKLYFMLGLPTETDEDLAGIYLLAKKVADLGESVRREIGGGKRVTVTVSVSSFVPKAHTPFQWFAQDTRDELRRKQRYLESLFKKSRGLALKYHDVDVSFIEAVLARADRRVAGAIYEAWRRGAKLEGWSEFFCVTRWEEAFAACGLDPAFYANRPRRYTELLPWEIIDSGVSKEFLAREADKALAGSKTVDCRADCEDCGVCPGLKVANRLRYRDSGLFGG